MVVGSGEAFSNNVVVSGSLVVCGRPGASLSPGPQAHIVVTNGGDLVVRDLTIGDRTGDTFIRIDGGTMTLGSGAVLTNLVCSNNKYAGSDPAGPVSVANGTLRLETGSRIVGCSASGATKYGGGYGGGAYLKNGAVLELAGGEISGCTAIRVGGGVYVSPGAVVRISAPSVVSGNLGNGNFSSGGAASDVFFPHSDSYTNVIQVVDGIAPASEPTVGVRYSKDYGNTNGFVFAKADSAVAADNAKAMFFNDFDPSLTVDVSGSDELAWAVPPVPPSGPQPVDPSDPSAPPAVAMTVYPAGATNHWASVQDAFAYLDSASGNATVVLLGEDSFDTNIVVRCDVTLLSAPGIGCILTRTDDASIVVCEGASLSVSNVGFTASFSLVASASYFRVAGGSLVFIDRVDVFDVASYGSRVAAVEVADGESSGGWFEMRGDSSIRDCVNYMQGSAGLAGGILVYGDKSPTAVLSGGIVTNCFASRVGGVFVGGANGELRLSGNVDIVGNMSVSRWLSPVEMSSGNVSVAANASLVLEDVFAGSVGVLRDGAEKAVFGRIDMSTFSGSDADCVESAMNFTSDDGYGYGVVVRSAGGEALLAWSEKLGADGTYTDAGGVEYSLVSDSSVPFPVDPPVAVAGLVYGGELQTGVVAHAGYVLSGNFAATNAGDYVATATLAPGYVWSDGSEWATNVSWSIAKADYDMGGVVFEDKTEKFDGEMKHLTVSGKLPDGIEVGYVPNGCVNPGAYEVTATFFGEDTENYNDIPDMTAMLTIVREIQLPTARTNLVYNADEQSGVVLDTEYATVLSGGEGTDAGTNYTAVVSLGEYCVWPDGSTNDVEVVWSISPARLVIVASNAWKCVGADDPLPFKYGVDGLQGTDTAEDVLVGELEIVGGDDGTALYSIGQGSLAVKQGVANYVIESFELGEFEIRNNSPQPLPVAFTAVAGDSGTWTLTITTAVEKCWYSLYETNSLSGGFKIDGVDPVTNRQATAGDVPAMSFERPANGSQLFWRIVAEPSDAY